MLNILLSLLPSPLAILFRRLLGAKIGSHVHLAFGAIIMVPNRQLVIGNRVSIKPLALVRCKKLSIGDYSSIASFVKINLEQLRMGKHTAIGTFTTLGGGVVSMDDHSRVFEYCYIDATRQVNIGKRVGIGGHNLIFTHGSWSNYLEGAPVSFGEVTIEDNVWLPWRVFILPNVVIGKDSIIGANSLVNKSIPENSLAAGTPAVVIKENIIKPDSEKRLKRALEVVNLFKEKSPLTTNQIFVDIEPVDAKGGDVLFFVSKEISKEKRDKYLQKGVNVIDYINENIHVTSNRKFCDNFVFHLTMFGIRLYIIENE